LFPRALKRNPAVLPVALILIQIIMPGRSPISGAEWQKHKATIEDLYMTKGMKLADLMQTMKMNHGFSATKSQYTTKFKTWNFQKNYSPGFWRSIKDHLERTGHDVADANLEIYGHPIKRKKLVKAVYRYDLPTLRPLSKQAVSDAVKVKSATTDSVGSMAATPCTPDVVSRGPGAASPPPIPPTTATAQYSHVVFPSPIAISEAAEGAEPMRNGDIHTLPDQTTRAISSTESQNSTNTATLPRQLLKFAAPVALSEENTSWLRSAIEKSNVWLVEKLLESGADPNTGWSKYSGKLVFPVEAACTIFNIRILLRLLQYRARVTGALLKHVTDKWATWLDMRDPENELLEIVDFLLRKGLTINAMEPHTRRTLLHYSICYSRNGIANLFLDYGADPNLDLMEDKLFRITPLQSAILDDKQGTVVKRLLAAGANANAPASIYIHTALCRAVQIRGLEFCRELLAHGANPHMVCTACDPPMTPMERAHKDPSSDESRLIIAHSESMRL
jgi:Clr5 domain/Ankyrin repeat